MKQATFLFMLMIWLTSCPVEPPFQITDVGVVDGVVPVYFAGDWKEIYVSGPEPIKHLAKIYYYNGYIFINESLTGIHIYDNTDPENPVRIKFIHIVGNKDISISDGFLYADNYTDLVTLDIHDIDNIHVVDRISNYKNRDDIAQYPPSYSGYFQCPDTEKGLVVGWEEAEIENPDCYIQ